ncbi:sigma-70 family RNA polymerase sigma factor [Paenibacillus sp. HB172176]|uniref:sigma-70 family RNA polymerase sigma factor n=1 Tax=Paenibacillus sp. HB172176 TaxID=2493690 RepID=UPI00143AB538|nr:sigma-70 family RNA polymerase sigma factor [Paenibacillus sp. HB172176]
MDQDERNKLEKDKEEWTRAALKGDDDALLKRIECDKSKMFGIAFSYMRNEEDALEAIQETVSRVWLKRKSLRDARLFTTWMIRILIHICMDERKKRKKELPMAEVVWNSNTSEPDVVASLHMKDQVAKLEPKYRMVIVLKYYRDMTITEIAELLEKPNGTIRTWLHQGLKRLRKGLGAGEEAGGNGRKVEEGWREQLD